MTDYSERLDEILAKHGAEPGEMTHSLKRAFTSLIKELVEEAKPFYELVPPIGSVKDREMKYAHRDGRNQAIKEFEQNLLKALEEV